MAYPPVPRTRHRDPVCRNAIPEATVAAMYRHEDKEYKFCSKSCHERFRRGPDRYLRLRSTQANFQPPAR